MTRVPKWINETPLYWVFWILLIAFLLLLPGLLLFIACIVSKTTSASGTDEFSRFLFRFRVYLPVLILLSIYLSLMMWNEYPHQSLRKEWRTWSIVFLDWGFEESATLRLLTLQYALIKGLLFGMTVSAVAAGGAIIFATKPIGTWTLDEQYLLLHPLLCYGYALLSLFLILQNRLYFESRITRLTERQEAIRCYRSIRQRYGDND